LAWHEGALSRRQLLCLPSYVDVNLVYPSSTGRKFVVYVEGALYSSISLLEIGTDVMPTPQGWEGNYAYL